MLKTYLRCLLLLSIAIGVCSAPCPAGVKCWIMQTEANRNTFTVKRINEACTITRDPNFTDIDGQPMVTDPCMDEENRNFMQCVLKFNTSLTNQTSDPDYNTGTCQCYKAWSKVASPQFDLIAVYNHSVNSQTDSQDWFIYDSQLKECVIKNKKRCAPYGETTIPYRCETVPGVDGEKVEGRCLLPDDDPEFKICMSGGDTQWAGFPIVIITLLLHKTVAHVLDL